MRKEGDWAKCDHCERLVEDPWRWGESLMCDTCYGWATTSGASEDGPIRRQEAARALTTCVLRANGVEVPSSATERKTNDSK